MVTPRVRFCWLCGKKLRGNSFAERDVDGHVRILHLTCSNSLDSEERLGPITSSAFGDEDDFMPLTDTEYLEDYRDDDE